MSLIQKHISRLSVIWIFGFPIIVLLFSCSDDRKFRDLTTAESFVMDAITSGRINNAQVQLLEWYELFGRSYSREKQKTETDANGHFIISYYSNPKYDYSLLITKDLYYDDDFTLPIPYKANLVKFPFGFIRTHITNKIDSAKWIDISYSPIFRSEMLFRDGFVNIQLFSRAFHDTTFVTSTIGGVMNKLQIKVNYNDYIPAEKIVKDTSVLTVRFDTIDVNIILF